MSYPDASSAKAILSKLCACGAFSAETVERGVCARCARLTAIETAARALLEALPRCEADGCDRLATGEHTQDYHPVGTYYCDEHSRYRNVRDLPWCDGAAALGRLVTK